MEEHELANYFLEPFDDYLSIERNTGHQDIYSLQELEYNPDAAIPMMMVTLSGLSIFEMMTAILLKVGYTQVEIAEYRGVHPNSVNKTINRGLRKLGL